MRFAPIEKSCSNLCYEQVFIEKDGYMIKTSTDISIVTAQLVTWTVLLLLSDFEKVITTPYLIAIVLVGLSINHQL